jgi:phosphohistidine phosphatase SixA
MKKTIEYYLMRHASYYDQENQFITYRGMNNLKISMDKLRTELNEKFPGKKLRITHSMLPRAKHTMLLMEEMLSGLKVFHTNDPCLNSDKLEINEAYIRKVVSKCEKDNEICLILSHQPDIEYFSKVELSTSQFISRTIELEEDPPKNSEDDDLPF